jgi:hypothetical protein
VWGTNVGSGDNVPLAYVPDRGKRPQEPLERAASIMVKNPDGILSHKEPWLEIRNNSEGFAPHPSLIVGTFLLSCVAHWLARNASTDEINIPFLRRPWRERANVAPPLNMRPMLGEHAAGVVVNLNLPPAFHAGTLKPKVEAANASE